MSPTALSATSSHCDHSDAILDDLREEGRCTLLGIPNPEVRVLSLFGVERLFLTRAMRTELLDHGRAIEYASGRIPSLSSSQVVGAAIGKPRRARGENVPTAVVPRPLRK